MSEGAGSLRARLQARLAAGAARLGATGPVRLLAAVLDLYDRSGGGVTANGLAYSALFALVPGLLLVLSVVGLVVDDEAVRERIVGMIGTAMPPLEELSREAFAQVSRGAVPGGIVAVVGLLWGSSRFYAALDVALSTVFNRDGRRNELLRGVRGIVLSAVFVALPIAMVSLSSVVGWLVEQLPDPLRPGATVAVIGPWSSPIGLALVFVAGVALVYRYVPPVRVPVRSLWLPAVVGGLAIAAFTQVFAFVAPRLLGWTTLFGALVAVFAVLVWLSISLQVLLVGACWARVRMATGRR